MKKQIFNPYLPNFEYIPDGEPRVFQDRLYVYGSHDRFGSRFFCDNDYVLWSTPIDDLSDWKYHGIIFHKEDDPLNSEERNPLFAPDAIQGKDGNYYLYYAPCNTKSIGVAKAEKPYGPFTFLNHVKDKEGRLLGQRENDPYPFDPAILIDEGKIYLYLGFAPDLIWDFMEKEFGTIPLSSGAYVTELEDDMYTLKGDPQHIEITGCEDPGHDFFEAASIRKILDRYYFIYSSWNSHELCYGIGDDPKGPFAYKGILHDNGDIGIVSEKERVSYTGNNHGSLIQVKDQWYIFGHRQTNYSTFARQGIAEKIFMNPDGTFDQAEMTSCGLNDGLLFPQGTYGAFIACHLTSKDGAFHYMDNCEGEGFENVRESHPAFSQDGPDRQCDPGQYIKNLKEGSTAGFKYFEYKDEFFINVSTRGDEGSFEIRNKLNGELLGIIPLSAGDDWHESESIQIDIPECDRMALYFTYKGRGSIDFLSFSLN